jgi:UDP-N-acetylmuramyl pentapeptide phosphotransferase/UDP-N-acetylglucosamine-1-phosphate transferase
MTSGQLGGAALVAVAAAAASLAIWITVRRWFVGPRFERINYRGATLVTATGVVPGAVAALAVMSLRFTAIGDSLLCRQLIASAAVIAVFTVLGFVDDLWAGRSGGGFAGHLRELKRGKITTGFTKAVGGGLAALVAAAAMQPEPDSWVSASMGGSVIRDGALIALAANTINLFDRAPLRAVKAALLLTGSVAAASIAEPGMAIAAVALFAVGALAVPEAREHLMQGDSGANAIGAALGAGAVLSLSPIGRALLLFVLLALNLASEKISFTRVINQSRILRTIDRFGSPHRS